LNRIYRLLFTISFSLVSFFAVSAETIEVGVLAATPIQKAVYVKYTERFEAENPNVDIQLIFRPDSEFKKDLDDWLSNQTGPDIITWQGGRRLYQYVEKKQVFDLSDFYKKHALLDAFEKGALAVSSYNNRQYGIPMSYYHWGFFYRESVFDALDISPPSDWAQFIEVCTVLKENGITPIAIGAKFEWPVAAWFDYLNLRTNGLEFHQSLLQGHESFHDERIKNVFIRWKSLIDAGFFLKSSRVWTWSEAMPYLYHKKAGLTLIGNFFTSSIPEPLIDDFKFFRFPIIDPKVAVYEEAPLDLIMVPAYTQMSDNIEKLLLLFASAEFQAEFNETVGMISPNKKATYSSDYFTVEGRKTLQQAKDVSQFFDRDTSEPMATASTAILTQFLQDADVDKAMSSLEKARSIHLLNTTPNN
jgi:multiple sugar transport system substrate-binding protein